MIAVQQAVLDSIKCFRRQWPLFSNSERTTVCGADCMLVALQLAMAEVNKQLHGDFAVSLSEVLETWKYFLHDKLGLSYESMKEPKDYAGVKRAYCAFLARSSMLDLIDVCQQCRRLQLLPEEEPLDAAQLLAFLSGITNAQDSTEPLPSAPPPSVNGQGQEHAKVTVLARKCVCSYLSLLVNSRDDLALAHVLNVPDRGLGREAFTDLKHASRETGMSILLMATSFIRTMELGGRGCASSLLDPVRAHAEGLSDFIHFIDKLQEIVGETLNPRLAGGRILSAVKMHLIKGRSSGDPFCQAVEEVVRELDLKITNIINSQEEGLTASAPGVSPARVMRLLLILLAFGCVVLEALLHTVTPKQLQGLAVVWQICGLRRLTNLGRLGVHCHFTVYRNPSKEKAPQSKNSPCVICSCEHVKLIPGCCLQMKQSSIKSQFACTYKTDPSERRCSGSNRAPARRDPAPESRAKARCATEGGSPCLDVPVLATISENVHQTRSYRETGKRSCQPRRKSSRSEQMALNNGTVICDGEGEPAWQKNAKRPKASSSSGKRRDSEADGTRKARAAVGRNRLIAGQAKITRFFRL
ncbi:PARI protein, partial [Upupa epops]|nr:PARI protein [Upupa epops]